MHPFPGVVVSGLLDLFHGKRHDKRPWNCCFFSMGDKRVVVSWAEHRRREPKQQTRSWRLISRSRLLAPIAPVFVVLFCLGRRERILAWPVPFFSFLLTVGGNIFSQLCFLFAFCFALGRLWIGVGWVRCRVVRSSYITCALWATTKAKFIWTSGSSSSSGEKKEEKEKRNEGPLSFDVSDVETETTCTLSPF